MTRSIAAGKGHVEIGIRNRIAQGARGVQSDLNKLGNSLKGQGARIAGIGGAIAAAAVGPLAMVISKASEMQETMGKFEVVFGSSAQAVQQWSNTTASSMGISEQSMASMLSGMQDLLVPMGVMDSTATDMSKELSKLAVDLASFNNMDSAKTFEDLMAAMTGSGEVMKKYGVILSETAVKEELLRMKLDPKTTDNAAKAQARLNIIMRGTTAAQGDAIRTSGSFANQMKSLWSTVSDVSAAIGGPLLDDLAGMLRLINHGINGVKDFVKNNEELVRMVGLAAIAVGGVGTALVAAGGFVIVAGFAFTTLAAGIGLLMSPIALAIGGIAALGFALVQYTDLGADAIDWLKDRFGPLVDTVQGAISAIMEALRSGDIGKAWELTIETLELVWLDMTEGIRAAWASVMGYVLDAGSMTASGIGQIFQSLGSVLESMLDKYKSIYDSVYNASESFFSDIGQQFTGVKTIGAKSEPKTSAFESQFGGAEDSIRTAIDNVKRFGITLEETADSQIVARAEERKLAAEQRAAKREELNVSLTTAAFEAVESKRERIDRESKLPGDVKITAAEIGPAAELSKQSGPTGTFSAFGAALAGGGLGVDKQMLSVQERSNKVLESIKNSSAAMVREAKKKNVARFA